MNGIYGLKSASIRIRDAVLKAVDPGAALRKALSLHGGLLRVAGRDIEVKGRLVLASAGKAALPMTEAALKVLGGDVLGLAVIPHGYGGGKAYTRTGIEILSARHPVPDQGSVRAAARLIELFGGLGEKDVCIFLLSGGGSSLLCLPQPPLGLEDKIRTTDLLLKSGADIRQINTVRKHMSGIKGGRLAERNRGAVVSLIVSDVAGDDASAIASGPTLADPTTFRDAETALRRSGIWNQVPEAVRTHMENGVRGRIPETPKSLPARHSAQIICSNAAALRAASAEAASCGFAPLILARQLSGEAREAGAMLAAHAIKAEVDARRTGRPTCIIAGGETTVTVKGTGWGGRNQEIALAAALALEGRVNILLASFATDGIDGVTEAAGAWSSGETAAAIRSRGIDPERSLSANDSYTALLAAGELIVTGPTHTNVNDVCIILIDA
jgi:glycerate 2-kinase